jgi:hypothetical protein
MKFHQGDYWVLAVVRIAPRTTMNPVIAWLVQRFLAKP